MIRDIDFSQPKMSRKHHERIRPVKKRKLADPTEEEKTRFIDGLTQTYPDSAIFIAFMPKQPATT